MNRRSFYIPNVSRKSKPEKCVHLRLFLFYRLASGFRKPPSAVKDGKKKQAVYS